ncbi:MAG: hydroxyacid dehydrogenase [Fimbriimonadaceae bacterium]|nr:hydroxyacid dehydrogenase [Fimbriimonadaceae bacterium]
MSKRTVLMAMPREAYARTLRASETARLESLYEVIWPATKPTTAELIALGAGHELAAVLTVWGAPAVPVEFWQAHPECHFFGHCAGSVKHFFPDPTPQYLLDHQITVVAGQIGLGINVAEATIGLMIALSRRWGTLWHACRHERAWRIDSVPGEPQGLLGATVGLVAASAIGKMVIEMLRPFRCQVLVYDPYLSDREAGRLGVERVELHELLSRADIISMHHPQTPETDRLIGAAEFAQIRDGAVFINTARPRALDPDALLAAAQQQRFEIALDVTEPEPLPADHALRACPNVWIMPHRAGTGQYGSLLVGDLVMEGLDQHLQGRPVTSRYPIERLHLMA